MTPLDRIRAALAQLDAASGFLGLPPPNVCWSLSGDVPAWLAEAPRRNPGFSVCHAETRGGHTACWSVAFDGERCGVIVARQATHEEVASMQPHRHHPECEHYRARARTEAA